MLEKRREYCLGSGDILRFRMWNSFTPVCMQGLSHSGIPPPPVTVAEFLAANHFATPHDEENTGSGLAPLQLASISGNVKVVRELIRSHNVDVNARVQMNDLMGDFGFERGSDALGMAAFACPAQQAHEIVSTLLEAGANPNSRTGTTGGTPLMCAVLGHSLESVQALLTCVQLDLEIGLRATNATALNIAGALGTYAIVEALLHAGADRFHRCPCWSSRLR